MTRGSFRLADALRLNRAAWAVIGLASIIMLARFSEAFVLLKALEAGFTPAWVPMSLVIMHAAYGLTAFPVGRAIGPERDSGLATLELGLPDRCHLTLAFATTVWVYVLGTVLWGLHMGFSQGLLGAMIAAATPDHLKGSAFGTFNLVTGIVVLVGNTIAGGLWHSTGSTTPFLVGAGLSAVAMIGMTLGTYRSNQG